jgi:uncharacterized protein (DUF305 family)
MKRALAVSSILAVMFAASGSGAALAAPAGPAADETAYLAQNQQAMDKMMAGMNVKPSGDVDRDFAAMMIPHHQGAIDMAVLELRYGHNEQLRRLAQGVIVDQQQEIVVMRHVLAGPPSPALPAPGQPAPGMTTPMDGQGASQ